MAHSPSVVMPLANGFEEIEAVTIVDVLRRAGCRVLVAGLSPGSAQGAHGLFLLPDLSVDAAEIAEAEIDLVVLPGGMPGAKILADDIRVQDLLRRQFEAGRRVAAICAAPMALSAFSAERRLTCFPGFEARCTAAELREERVVIDGPVITSRAAGTAMEFALALVEELCGAARAEELAAAMLVAPRDAVYRA
jgi:protein deglycase